MNSDQIKLAAETIKNSVSMIDVCEEYGIRINRGGFICCPFHSDGSPSMKVYPGSRGFFCYACHEGGDVIKFVSKINCTPFLETMRTINRDFGLGISFDELSNEELAHMRRKALERKEAQRKHDEAVSAAQKRYDEALDKVVLYDKWINEFGPDANGEVKDQYVVAISQISAAEYELMNAEFELNKVKGKSNGSS